MEYYFFVLLASRSVSTSYQSSATSFVLRTKKAAERLLVSLARPEKDRGVLTSRTSFDCKKKSTHDKWICSNSL
eukprot:scaffold19678_cov157-Amphora_coffeaeformis.AAC.3